MSGGTTCSGGGAVPPRYFVTTNLLLSIPMEDFKKFEILIQWLCCNFCNSIVKYSKTLVITSVEVFKGGNAGQKCMFPESCNWCNIHI